MSKELEYLREDYKQTKSNIEANNRILEQLLKEPLVRIYRDTYIENEKKKKELSTLEVSLAYQEMMECEHNFVRTEIIQERDYDRIIREPIYHCLKCGLTNEYIIKEVNPILLSKSENNMSYIFKKTSKNGIILHERSACPLEVAKEIYEEITKNNKDMDNEELKTYFLVALSKNDPTYYQDLTYEIKRLARLIIDEEPKTLQRIELRQRDIPVIDSGITCYELSEFNKDLFEFVRIIKKRAGVDFTSLEDLSKYPKIVIEEIENLNEKEKNSSFAVMAMPNPKAYVVAPDKARDFKNAKPNPEFIKRNEELAQKFRINNLTQEGNPKKRVKTKSE